MAAGQCCAVAEIWEVPSQHRLLLLLVGGGAVISACAAAGGGWAMWVALAALAGYCVLVAALGYDLFRLNRAKEGAEGRMKWVLAGAAAVPLAAAVILDIDGAARGERRWMWCVPAFPVLARADAPRGLLYSLAAALLCSVVLVEADRAFGSIGLLGAAPHAGGVDAPAAAFLTNVAVCVYVLCLSVTASRRGDAAAVAVVRLLAEGRAEEAESILETEKDDAARSDLAAVVGMFQAVQPYLPLDYVGRGESQQVLPHEVASEADTAAVTIDVVDCASEPATPTPSHSRAGSQRRPSLVGSVGGSSQGSVTPRGRRLPRLTSGRFNFLEAPRAMSLVRMAFQLPQSLLASQPSDFAAAHEALLGMALRHVADAGGAVDYFSGEALSACFNAGRPAARHASCAVAGVYSLVYSPNLPKNTTVTGAVVTGLAVSGVLGTSAMRRPVVLGVLPRLLKDVAKAGSILGVAWLCCARTCAGARWERPLRIVLDKVYRDVITSPTRDAPTAAALLPLSSLSDTEPQAEDESSYVPTPLSKSLRPSSSHTGLHRLRRAPFKALRLQAAAGQERSETPESRLSERDTPRPGRPLMLYEMMFPEALRNIPEEEWMYMHAKYEFEAKRFEVYNEAGKRFLTGCTPDAASHYFLANLKEGTGPDAQAFSDAVAGAITVQLAPTVTMAQLPRTISTSPTFSDVRRTNTGLSETSTGSPALPPPGTAIPNAWCQP